MLPWKQALICAKKNMNTLCFLFSHLHLNIKCKKHNYREGCSSLREHQTHSLVREKIKVPFSTINEPILCFLEFFMDYLTNISLSVYGVIFFSKTKLFFFPKYSMRFIFSESLQTLCSLKNNFKNIFWTTQGEDCYKGSFDILNTLNTTCEKVF